MALSEIEKLERRYAENPQGLTFAPLAEIQRKNGEVQRALDLLGPGLQIHPDYIPASIVLGRCHMDLGDVHAAEAAFLHVLALDAENVIALKALADISERLLRFDQAERWLHTLLSVDRSNDEAREQLQRVEISRRQSEMASSAAPSSLVEEPSVVEEASVVEPPPPSFEPPVAEPAVGWVSQSAAQADRSPPMGMEDLEPSALREDLGEPAGMQPEEPSPLVDAIPVEDSIEPLADLVGREVEAPDDLDDDFRVETSEDIILESAGGSEFQMPDASQELFERGAPSSARGERARFEEDAPVAPSAAREAPLAERTEPQAAASEPVAPEAVAPEAVAPEAVAPAPFVYEPPPEEPARAAPAAVPSEPEPLPSDFRYHRRDESHTEAPAATAQPKRSYGVGETGGRSVVQLFKGILSARPPAQASAAAVRQTPTGSSGAPTRPAADALSLSSVFGEEASETPPAVPAPSQGAGSVSFDDFFSSPSASPATRAPRAPDPKSDDLDQFHTWLQNLKR